MKAGACELDITPAVGSEIPGQWLRRTATHVRDALKVNALAFESQGTPAALVSCDALSLKNRVVADLRRRLSSLVNPECLLLAATHTHTGPPICDVLGSTSDETTIAALVDAIEQAVRTAFDRFDTARVGWATTPAPGFAFPRRWRMADGTAQMHPRKDDPNLVEPESDADDTLTVMSVCRPDGSPIALAVNFACHATFVGGERYYCADYPGVVRRSAQQALGEDAVVLYLNGPCGDVCQDDVADLNESRFGEEPMERIGAQLAARAVSLATQACSAGALGPAKHPIIRGATELIPIAVRAVPDADLRRAEEWAVGRSLDEVPQNVDEIKMRELLIVEQERRDRPILDIEAGGLRVGDGALVALPGEIFASIGRDIRADSPFRHTAIVELANGCYGYVPIADAFPRGGYETWLCRSSRLMPEAAGQMVEAGRRVLARLAAE
jgi:neutral ceramidase